MKNHKIIDPSNEHRFHILNAKFRLSNGIINWVKDDEGRTDRWAINSTKMGGGDTAGQRINSSSVASVNSCPSRPIAFSFIHFSIHSFINFYLFIVKKNE